MDKIILSEDIYFKSVWLFVTETIAFIDRWIDLIYYVQCWPIWSYDDSENYYRSTVSIDMWLDAEYVSTKQNSFLQLSRLIQRLWEFM